MIHRIFYDYFYNHATLHFVYSKVTSKRYIITSLILPCERSVERIKASSKLMGRNGANLDSGRSQKQNLEECAIIFLKILTTSFLDDRPKTHSLFVRSVKLDQIFFGQSVFKDSLHGPSFSSKNLPKVGESA